MNDQEKALEALKEIKEWAEAPCYLVGTEGYAKGYREAFLFAKEIVCQILESYDL